MTDRISASRWERILVDHYLDTQGPWGDGEISYIDARPEQLARALEIQTGVSVSANEARSRFVGVFNANEINRVFNIGDVPRSNEPDLPGYFRHLVLTCMIPAIDDEIGTNNFRVRFGHEILGPGRKIRSLRHLSGLWEELVRWIADRNAVGQRLRRLRLPDRAKWTRIGYSLKLAFPSWRDRNAMRNMISGSRIRNPRVLVVRLEDQIAEHGGSGSLVAAYDDFRTRYRRGERMLQQHPFWLLTREILEEDAGIDDDPLAEPLVLELREGLDGDIEFQLRFSGAEAPIEVGDFPTIRRRLDSDLPGHLRGPATGLKDVLSRGWIVLERSGLGVWASDPCAQPRDLIRIVASASRQSEWGGFLAFVPQTDTDWAVSEAMDPTDVDVASIIGCRHTDEDALIRPAVVFGGVRVGKDAYLGRNGTLPLIRAPESAEIHVEPADAEASATVRVVRGHAASEFEIATDRALAGQWNLTIRERSTNGEQGIEQTKTLRFEAFARIYEDLAAMCGRDSESDPETIVCRNESLVGSLGTGSAFRTNASAVMDARASDVAELVYATGRGGIAESALLPALGRILGAEGPSAWDVLRGFQEAGWLDVRRTEGWGTRKWFLRPPRLVRSAGPALVVDGAMPNRWVEHLRIACLSAGAGLEERASLSPWSPPLLMLADDDRATAVAASLEWPIMDATWPVTSPPPACWPRSPYTVSGRRPGSVWSWKAGRFVKPHAAEVGSERVGIVRWVRDRSDSPAIHVVSGPSGNDLVTESRTAAIIEAHRRAGRPLFGSDGTMLCRMTNEGFLPLSLVRAMRWSALGDGGPVRSFDRRFGYCYRAPAELMDRLRSILGAVVGGTGPGDDDRERARVLAARRTPAGRYIRRRPNFL